MPLNLTLELAPLQLAPLQLTPAQYISTDLQTKPDSTKRANAVGPATLYSSERSFTAAKYEESVWNRLLPGDVEGYHYHLAVEISKMRDFRTGIAAVKRGGIVVCLAPYFVAEHFANPLPEENSNGTLPLQKSPEIAALRRRVICVGSPVTSHGKLGISQDYPLDSGMIAALNEQLELIAQREGISTIAYKDMSANQAQPLGAMLQESGFMQLDGKPLLNHSIRHLTIEDYMAELGTTTLNQSIAERMEDVLKLSSLLQIEVSCGLPTNMQALYALYENSHQGSADLTQKLSPEFFESVAALMPNDCRFVQYRLADSAAAGAGQLIGFSMLLYRDGIAVEKCRVLDAGYVAVHVSSLPHDGSTLSASSLFSLMWLRNLQLCMQDGLQDYRHQYLGDDLEQGLVTIGWADVKTSHSYFRQVSAKTLT